MSAIASAADLLELKATLLTNPPKQFNFALSALSTEENRRLSVVMSSYASECGCNSGSFVMSAGFTGIVLHYFGTGGHWADLGRREWLWLVAWTAGFALAGKAAGLFWARWRMFSLTAKTLERIAHVDVGREHYGTRMHGDTGLGRDTGRATGRDVGKPAGEPLPERVV